MPDPKYTRAKNPGRGLEKFLGELQLSIMEIIWERDLVNVSDVLRVLNEQNRNLAYTTVMTILSRLAEKGWLIVEKRGRAFFYRAAHSRVEAEMAAVREVVRALLKDFGEVAIAQFAKELDEIDPTQLSHLVELAREVEQNDDQ